MYRPVVQIVIVEGDRGGTERQQIIKARERREDLARQGVGIVAAIEHGDATDHGVAAAHGLHRGVGAEIRRPEHHDAVDRRQPGAAQCRACDQPAEAVRNDRRWPPRRPQVSCESGAQIGNAAPPVIAEILHIVARDDQSEPEPEIPRVHDTQRTNTVT